jgi:hypothetical protein
VGCHREAVIGKSRSQRLIIPRQNPPCITAGQRFIQLAFLLGTGFIGSRSPFAVGFALKGLHTCSGIVVIVGTEQFDKAAEEIGESATEGLDDVHNQLPFEVRD